jgi:hypothetical protein
VKPLYISKSRSEEIQMISEIEIKDYDSIISGIGDVSVSSGLSKLQQYFERKLDDTVAEILLRHVVSLCAFCDKEDCEPAEALAALREGLIEAEWNEADLGRFDQKRPKVEEIIAHDAVYLTTKAGQLFATDQNHLHSVRAIADIRPVFGRKRENIRASLVYSTLSLVVGDSSENETSIAVALRYDELKRLRRECDRAMQKIEAIRELSDPALGTLLVYGESHS